MPLGFLFSYPHIFTKMPLGLHIYIPLFSLQPPLPFSFLNFVPHKRLTKKKLSRRRQPLTATRHRQPCQCSLSLSPSRCLHATVSPSQPHTAANPANSLSHSPPHAAFTPPPAFHHRSNFDLLHACPATIPNEQKKISQNLFTAYSCVNFFFSPISTLKKYMLMY